MGKTLVVAAHPDDEVLGCGGTIARFTREDGGVYVLILGEGAASRHASGRKAAPEIRKLKKEAVLAGRILGVEKTWLFDFPDNRFDTVALLDIIKTVEMIKKKVGPSVVFTHHHADLNIDHRITYRAVLTACRPLKGESVREIYSFAVPSSTEWSYPDTFTPNIFIDVSGTIDLKIDALKVYGGEVRDFPHPRSERSIRESALAAGSLAGMACAEAFRMIRCLK